MGTSDLKLSVRELTKKYSRADVYGAPPPPAPGFITHQVDEFQVTVKKPSPKQAVSIDKENGFSSVNGSTLISSKENTVMQHSPKMLGTTCDEVLDLSLSVGFGIADDAISSYTVPAVPS